MAQNISDEDINKTIEHGRLYTVVFLKKGSNHGKEQNEKVAKEVQMEHL